MLSYLLDAAIAIICCNIGSGVQIFGSHFIWPSPPQLIMDRGETEEKKEFNKTQIHIIYYKLQSYTSIEIEFT